MVPDSSESLEMCIQPVVISHGMQRALGALYLSSFRLVAICPGLAPESGDPSSPLQKTLEESPERLLEGPDEPPPTTNMCLAVPFGLLASASLTTAARSHFTTSIGKVA
jgi:hypothetical protein